MRTIHPMAAIVLALGLALAMPAAHGADLLLRVEITGARSTDWSSDCGARGDIDAGCLPWNVWHVYQARVKQVLAGEYAAPTVVFAMYAHSRYSPGTFGDWYVRLHVFDHAGTVTALGAPLYSREPFLPRSHVCLDAALPVDADGEPREDPWTRREGAHCYDTRSFGDRDAFHDCDDLATGEAAQACRAYVLGDMRSALAALERDAYTGVAAAMPASVRRARARAASAFHRDMEATCALAAATEPDDGERPRARSDCAYGMLAERLRMLRRVRDRD